MDKKANENATVMNMTTRRAADAACGIKTDSGVKARELLDLHFAEDRSSVRFIRKWEIRAGHGLCFS